MEMVSHELVQVVQYLQEVFEEHQEQVLMEVLDRFEVDLVYPV